ncbi:MAG: TMEM175 family protein [Allosphingosinicella sp.]
MVEARDDQLTPRRDQHPGDGVARGTGRMEAFADAVFAIAFTLPIVGIALPNIGGKPLAGELVALWPDYLGYVLASLVIGIYWEHHHFSGAIYRTTGHYFNLATVLFLAAVGFIAFPARVFAAHIADPDPAGQATAAQYFVVALAFTALTWLLKWSVGRKTGHVDRRLEPAYISRLNRRYWAGSGTLVAAAALSFAYWPAGLAVAALTTLSYLLPPETPAYISLAPVVEGAD